MSDPVVEPEFDGSYEVEWTRFGFIWGPCHVERVSIDRRGGVHLYITGGSGSAVMVYVSPKGRVVKAYDPH